MSNFQRQTGINCNNVQIEGLARRARASSSPTRAVSDKHADKGKLMSWPWKTQVSENLEVAGGDGHSGAQFLGEYGDFEFLDHPAESFSRLERFLRRAWGRIHGQIPPTQKVWCKCEPLLPPWEVPPPGRWMNPFTNAAPVTP